MSTYLRTSDIAKRIGVHVNTVRLYEAQGYLSAVPRSPTGYRRFSLLHLEQMRLAQLALQWPYTGDKAVVVEIIRCAADGETGMAMELAYKHLVYVRVERTQAEAAAEFLERWAQGGVRESQQRRMRIGEAARHLGVTVDQLRNWDRSGLVEVPRDPDTGYRTYSASMVGRLRVIRILRQSGYSLMAILRMLRQFDSGERARLRVALDTPGEAEDVVTVADRWLSTLHTQETRAQAMIQQIGVLATMMTP